jgi:hypothetical protein
MPANIGLKHYSGYLFLKLNPAKTKFLPHISCHDFSDSEECYLFNLNSTKLYRGLYKRINAGQFAALGLEKAGVKHSGYDRGDFFLGLKALTLDSENKVISGQGQTSALCASLSSTAPGLPTPAIGLYSSVELEPALMATLCPDPDQPGGALVLGELEVAVANILTHSLQLVREDLEITEVHNRLYANCINDKALKRWQAYRALKEGFKEHGKGRVRLLSLVKLFQDDQTLAFDEELAKKPASVLSVSVFKSRFAREEANEEPRSGCVLQ